MKPENKTSDGFKEILNIEIPEDILEFDVVARIPPVKETIERVKVQSVEKATPCVVEPDGF